jgi:hypothetical protein
VRIFEIAIAAASRRREALENLLHLRLDRGVLA